MRTAFLAIALSGLFAGFVQAEDRETIEISHSSYAAIAYSPATGRYAYACDYRSRSGAETAALKKCGADDAVIACWVNWGFAALALGDDKSAYGVGWKYGGGANNQKANAKALEDCRNQTTGAYIALTISSDGQHIWDRKDHVTIIDKDGNIYRGSELITPVPKETSLSSGASIASKAAQANPSPVADKK